MTLCLGTDVIAGTSKTDDLSTTLNSTSKIQAIGVMDRNQSGNAVKTWTGTKAQYDEIVGNNMVDANTIYNITDDLPSTTILLDKIYPVGSLYFGTMATCPMAALIGTWTLVGTKILTDIPATLEAKGNGISLGLTDGTNNYGVISTRYSGTAYYQGRSTGAYGVQTGTSGFDIGNEIAAGKAFGLTTDSTKSGIVADTNATSLTVNIWKRIL